MYSRQLLPFAPEVSSRTLPSLPISIRSSWDSIRLLLIAADVQPDGAVRGLLFGDRRKSALTQLLGQLPIDVLLDDAAGEVFADPARLLVGHVALRAGAEAAAG